MTLETLFSAFSFSSIFLAVLAFGIFLPGFLLLRILLGKKNLNHLEAILFSFALGIGIVDASLLTLGNLGALLTAFNIALWYVLLIALFAATLFWRKIPLFLKENDPIFSSTKNFQIGVVIIILVFFIKAFYLNGTILPTATDLGHHLYWSKLTTDTQMLPTYQKQEIITSEDGSFTVSEPSPISDFIIGEHLPLSFIHIFTDASYFGTFPLLFLFLLNITSVLGFSILCFFFCKHIFSERKAFPLSPSSFFLLALFVFGGLFALASPEMKFVSGGVIGNLFGNFFLPLTLLALFKTLMEKSAPWLTVFLLLTATLAYTHHLSTLVILYVLFFLTLTLLIFWRQAFFQSCKDWLPLIWKPNVLAALAGIALFAAFIALPTYLETNAVGTALGTPTKTTRTGMSFLELTLSNSAYKLGLAIFSLIIIASFTRLRNNLAAVILFAYGAILLVMTLTPNLVFLDIPSNRISHYLSYPLTLLALFATFFILEKYLPRFSHQQNFFKNPFFIGGSVLFFLALVAPGLEDNSKTLVTNDQALYVQETFKAADYLKGHVAPGELILKDHNFIQASDTWMKLFFSQDYNYPFSRSYFKRYEDNPDREHCTLAMISTPNTAFGKKCYQDLPVRFLVVNPKFDQAQFLSSPKFSLIYSSPDVAVLLYSPDNQ